MAKNITLINIETLKTLMTEEKHKKIKSLIERKMLDKDALIYLLRNLDLGSYRYHNTVINNNNFQSIFSTIGEFMSDQAFYELMSCGEDNLIFKWVDCFYDSPEEMLAVFNPLKEYQKKKFCSYILPSTSRRKMPLKFSHKYKKCISAICVISKEVEAMGTSYRPFGRSARLIRNAQFLDYRSLMVVCDAERIPPSAIVSAVETRLRNKGSVVTDPSEVGDFMDIIDSVELGFNVKIERGSIIKCLEPTNKVGSETIDALGQLYSRYIKDEVRDCTLNALKLRLGIGNLMFICAYETSETLMDEVYKYTVEDEGYRSAFIYLSAFLRGGFEIQITDYMHEISVESSCSWNSFLLKEDITTAKQAKALNEICFGRENRGIDTFENNPTLMRHFKLEMFSDEDLAEISDMLEWGCIKYYFKNYEIPFEFALKNIEKLDEKSFLSSYSQHDGVTYTSQQIAQLIGASSDEQNSLRGILFSETILAKDATNELIAQNIKKVQYFRRNYLPYFGNDGEKNSLNLNSILTLL